MPDLLSLTLRAPEVRDGVDVQREQFPERPRPLIRALDSVPDVVCLFADGYIDGLASRQPHARREQCDEDGAAVVAALAVVESLAAARISRTLSLSNVIWLAHY